LPKVAQPATVTEMSQVACPKKDSRRWDFSQRLPVRSGTG